MTPSVSQARVQGIVQVVPQQIPASAKQNERESGRHIQSQGVNGLPSKIIHWSNLLLMMVSCFPFARLHHVWSRITPTFPAFAYMVAECGKPAIRRLPVHLCQ